MKVSILQGAHRYVRITTDTADLDMLVSPGMADAASLRQSALEMRQQSYRLQRRAALCEDAALILDGREKD